MMSKLEKVYDLMPIFMQNLMCSVKGMLNNRSRYGREYWEYRNFLMEFDKLPLEKQLEYQMKELKDFLHYAEKNSKFYRELYNEIDLESIKSINDLAKLPIVDKEMLRSHINEVMTISRKGAVEGHTGGTTGKSLIVRSTVKDAMRRMAMLDHFKARVGFEHRKMKRATFNGKHIVPPKQKKKVYWRYNHACRQMIYSSFHLTEENMGAYVKSLNKYKPQALDGFFMSMCDLARYIERKHIELNFKPIAIFPTSETLTDEGRELLERVFKCKVYNQYASSEGAPFVTECKNQTLHMELASGVFEQIGENGEILVTSFTTHGTPLIRYRIGDCMIFAEDEKCSCGLVGPIVKEIQGRKMDFLYRSDGAKISAANLSNSLKNAPNNIIRAQFRQETIDKITILLEIDKEEPADELKKLVLEEMVRRFGKDTQVEIKIVDDIPREKSGKFRMVVNKVDM